MKKENSARDDADQTTQKQPVGLGMAGNSIGNISQKNNTVNPPELHNTNNNSKQTDTENDTNESFYR